MLLATAACNFSTSQLQKLRTCSVLYILTCKCASRYSGVPFVDIAISKSGPNPSVFWHLDLKMCFAPQRCAIFHVSSKQLPPHPPLYQAYFFDPADTQIIEKNTAFRDFPNISRVCIFFLLAFAQLYLLSSDSTSLLCFSSSDSTALHCFSTVHIVGS